MTGSDPYTPSGKYIYECRECLSRVESERRIETCPDCGGSVTNIAVPRE